MNAEIFRSNLRELLRTNGLKQKELAQKSGLNYSWVRKVCSQGLTRVEGRNRENLETLCEFVGVSPVENLWNPELLIQRDEASLYAAKVEKILRATRLSDNRFKYEPVAEHSVIELVEQIDLIHQSLEQHRETIGERQLQQADANRRSATSRRPSQPSEYAEKIRSLIRDDRPELRAVVAAILRMINGACDIQEGIQVEKQLKKNRPGTSERSFSTCGGNVGDAQGAASTSSPAQDDDVLPDQLKKASRQSKKKRGRIPSDVQELFKRARGDK